MSRAQAVPPPHISAAWGVSSVCLGEGSAYLPLARMMGQAMPPSPFPLHFVLLWSGSFLLPLRAPTIPTTSDTVLEPLIQPCWGCWLQHISSPQSAKMRTEELLVHCGGGRGGKWVISIHFSPPSSFFLGLIKAATTGYQHLCLWSEGATRPGEQTWPIASVLPC